MATVIIMPRQGQSVESCIITAFNKKVGDTVEVGDILFSYETDKSSFDEQSPVAGTVLAIFCGEGDDVPCLENVCVIGNAGEDFSEFIPKGEEAAPAPAEAAPAEAAAPAAVEASPAEASPVAVTATGSHKTLSPFAPAKVNTCSALGTALRIVKELLVVFTAAATCTPSTV